MEAKNEETWEFIVEKGGKRKEKVLSMSWSRKLNNGGWFSKCTVGILKEFSSISSVNHRLSSRGYTFSDAYLWNKCVIWSFESESDKDGFMNNRFFLDDCFLSMEKCFENFNPKARLAWIKFSGIPLQCWNSSFFKKVGWLFSEPLIIDEETLQRRRLYRVRIL